MSRGLSKIVRSGGIARVGFPAFSLYVVLRDRVWRSTAVGDDELRKAYASGLLVASMKRENLAAALGTSESTVKRMQKTLEVAGWIRIDSRIGTRPVYVLGSIADGEEIYLAETGQNDVGSLVEFSQYEEVVSDLVPIKEDPIRERAKEEITERRIRKATRIDPQLRSSGEATTQRKPWAALGEEPAPAEPVEMVVDGERTLHPDELRHLKSARQKAAAGRKADYTGQEAVAVWRQLFFNAFGCEDPDLTTQAARTRMASTFSRRAVEWAGSDRARLMGFLKAMIQAWVDKKETDRFPPGASPRLSSLLKKDKEGPSWFWRSWVTGKSRSNREKR